MQARIIDEKVRVHSAADPTSAVVAELNSGDEVTLGKTVREGGPLWVPAILSGGAVGYISGSSNVCRMLQVNLSRSVDVLESTIAGSKVKMTYKEGDTLTLCGVMELPSLLTIEQTLA